MLFPVASLSYDAGLSGMCRSSKHSSESSVIIHCVVLKIELFFSILSVFSRSIQNNSDTCNV